MRFFPLLLLLSVLLLKSLAQDKYLNVVLFFANYHKIAISRIAYVNVSKVAVVQPCINDQPKRPPCNFRKIARGTLAKKCNCQKSLNKTVYSLVNWARTSLQMATAIITLKNNNNENAVTYYLDIDGNKQPQQQNLLMKDPEKQDFGKLPLPPLPNAGRQNSSKSGLPKLEPQIPENEEDDLIIIINAYPPPMRFNPFLKRYSKHYENLKRVQRTIGVPPINHQVIHINSNKLNVPVPKSTNSMLDFFGSMSGIKDSFMANFVNPFLDPSQRNLEDDDNFDMSALGKVQKKSLFLITDRVLKNIKSVRDKRGFMLVVYGGELSMLDHPYSELVQSIKHILETCTDTLMVITSNCPKESASNGTKIPVFATGPFSEKISDARQLTDIARIVSNVLAKRNLETKDVS